MEEINEPTLEQERELENVLDEEPTEAEIVGTGKKYKIGWLKKATMRKLSKITLDPEKEDELSCKAAALIVLNGYWKIKFFYPILWRWWFYVCQYDDAQLRYILAIGKKKVPYVQYLMATMLVTGMRDTMMRMTRKEAERTQAELYGANPTP